MSIPSPIFTDGAQMGQIVGEILDIIVANTGYSESDAEIVALRAVATEISAATDSFIDLDAYPPGEPNTKALRERIVAALSGVNVPNGSETVLP